MSRVYVWGIALLVVVCSSCAHIVDNTVEVGKTIWGSSIRALEQDRPRAVTKTYDKPYWDCVRSTVNICKKHWVIFQKNEVKGYIVIIGVHGAVNTTEIGIFFDELSENKTRIEITSLSTNAKRLVAKGLFHGLDIAFGYLPPDPPEAVTLPAAAAQNAPQPAP
jgi:hypothetical protein